MRPEVCVVPLEAVESVLVDDVALRVLCLIASGTMPPTPVAWFCDLGDRLPYEHSAIEAALDQLVEAGFLIKRFNETYEVRLNRPADWPVKALVAAVGTTIEPPTDPARPTRRPISVAKRYRILQRDGFKCVYCGRSASDVAIEIDHYTPVSGGGSDDDSNLRAACRDCNAGKGASIP